ncbi:MAG: transketolase [Anaerolineae bacterium]
MQATPSKELTERSINTIRFLAVDAVQKANSGHPGLPMGAAVMAYTLWMRHLRFNPTNPNWFNRDRFILSAGHGAMLLYALLHLTGYDLPMEEIKQFRQWGSRTPGHPESFLTPGVEVTTGPLGQGFANGVGVAMAEKHLADVFNTDDHAIIDHHTYAIVSDGDLMEGVAAEAASLAGTLGLGKMIYLYDKNDISIEGDTDPAFREDVGARFEAYGWHVVGPIDGNDVQAVDLAIREAQAVADRPSLIICITTIGYGSPNKAGTGSAHGSPLGEEEVALTRENLGWPEEQFLIPDEVLAHFREAVERGQQWEDEWNERLAAYRDAHPDQAAELDRRIAGELPDGWEDALPAFSPEDGPMATRNASGTVLNAIFPHLPELIGGSGDLAPSTKTWLDDTGVFGLDKGGHNIQFGVREHAMGSIVLGMSHHGGVLPYAATFLAFLDYMRPPVRLASLSEQQIIVVYTHDSIGLGEDGPTHQPVEHLATLRAIPGILMLRPADANETVEAWRQAILNHEGPSVLVLTRQKLPIFDRSELAPAAEVAKGAYVLKDTAGTPDLILIATGSEVALALDAAHALADENIAARVVSMPSWELFDAQPADYRESVLPPDVEARLAVEAASPMGWHKYVGPKGAVIGLDRFGASAPGETVMKEMGFNVDNVVARAKALLAEGE